MEKQKLYYKKENGRYEEYHEPKRPMYDNALYRREGKKYVPVNMLLDSMSWQESILHTWSEFRLQGW